MAIGALVLVVLWKPWQTKWTPRKVLLAVVFGLSLATMNILFYEAIARIPLGAAVSIEFVGPVVVAIFRGRGWLTWVAAFLALAGVVLIGGWGLDTSTQSAQIGFLFALAAAAAWAIYIVLGSKISAAGPPGPSLALGLVVASLAYLPILGPGAFGFSFSWWTVLSLVAVGIFSSAIPYSFEAIAFSRLSAAAFALLNALLPATSAVVGALTLGQIPAVASLVGLVLVSVAVWLAGRASNTLTQADSPARNQ